GQDWHILEPPNLDKDRYGAYLSDLTTWYYDNFSKGPDTPMNVLLHYPVRIVWFEAVDNKGPGGNSPPFLGLYTADGHEKMTTTSLPSPYDRINPLLYCPFYFTRSTTGTGTINLSDLFQFVVNNSCY